MKNIDLVRKALKLFEGEHDFTSFSSRDDRSKILTLKSAAYYEDTMNDYGYLCFRAGHFLYHMVRKLASAVMMVDAGELSPEQIKDALNGKIYIRIHAALPYNLFLARIYYNRPDLFWIVEDQILDEIKNYLRSQEYKHRNGYVFMNAFQGIVSLFRGRTAQDLYTPSSTLRERWVV